MTAVIVIAVVVWLWLGVKTTSFILSDLADNAKERATVIVASMGGLVWPLVYLILLFFILFGVIYGESFMSSLKNIRNCWNKKE